MISDKQLYAALGNTLEYARFPEGCTFERGKVRDWFCKGDRRILVTSDRISAFDRVLGTIPFKGQVLNQLAAYWFEQTRHIVPNHIVSVPDPNIVVARECEQLSLEFIVRGYITGVTNTSAWTNYAKGVRCFCGHVLPEGLRKDQKLERPILTPTTKHEAHDRNVSREEAIAEGLIDAKTFDQASEICLKLYDFGVKLAASRGLILVDTKYELGLLDGKLVVSDEVNTPDSSRYWYADTYAERFAAGEAQRQIDKEYVRQWLAKQGFTGDGTPPVLPDDVRVEAAKRYMQAYELITGKPFEVSAEPVGSRVSKALVTLC
ncbi:MAG TPA: phosphoribosylaminoimidazolesuccinocarboxamide synthase [Verrucomicrobia bacterium]|nr:phosphoribosylaminoimidazolesuccinocarboxamide synthase [Verrucomicrobiota bacterium]